MREKPYNLMDDCKLDEHSDEALMERLKTGDRDAFSSLVRRHTQRFYMVAYRICLDQSEAEDAVQDAFLKLWKKPMIWNSGRGAKFTTWFTRIVLNASYDRMRKLKKYSDEWELDLIQDVSPTQDQSMEQQETAQMVENALRFLPQRQRTALILCFYEEISNKEAAEIMEIGIKALESLLMRGKKALRAYFEEKSR